MALSDHLHIELWLQSFEGLLHKTTGAPGLAAAKTKQRDLPYGIVAIIIAVTVHYLLSTYFVSAFLTLLHFSLPTTL